MAITSVAYAKDQGLFGRWSAVGPRVYTVTWQVTSNDLGDGPQTIINGVGANIGDTYVFRNERDDNAYLEDIEAVRVSADNVTGSGAKAVWIVTGNYGPFAANICGGGPQNNPLNYPPEATWNFRNFERIVEKDQNDKAIENTAGDPFVDPPVTIDDPRPVLTIVRNEESFDPNLAYQFRSAVNSDPFCGADPQQCKVLQISGKRQWNQDIGYYFEVVYEFEFNGLGFHARPLNQGYREKDSGGDLQHALYKGVPVTTPVLLGNDGKRLATGSDPIYLDFTVYPEVSYADAFNFGDFVLTGQGGKNQDGS